MNCLYVDSRHLRGTHFPYRCHGLDVQLSLVVELEAPAETTIDAHQRFTDCIARRALSGQFVQHTRVGAVYQITVSLRTVEEAPSELLRLQATAKLLLGFQRCLNHKGTQLYATLCDR